MNYKFPVAVYDICSILKDRGFQAYVVGGACRDLILGREPHDYDIATNALPEQVQAIFPKTLDLGAHFGTITVMMGGEGYEVTTYRNDGDYSDGRRPDGVVFAKTIEEDLSRRDFTMNAIAIDPINGTVVDPFGGEKDINAKLIRTVGDPMERFNEDGLRCMRAVRFMCQLGFRPDIHTLMAIPQCIETFKKVSIERVRDEFMKILQSPRPISGVSQLGSCRLLQEIMPELISTMGIVQNSYHKFDVYGHIMMTVEAAPRSLRLTALLHDIGKPLVQAPKRNKPGEYSFIGHEKASADMANRIMRKMKFSNEERNRVVHLIESHDAFMQWRQMKDSTLRKAIARIGGIDNLNDILALRLADMIGQGVHEDPQHEVGCLRDKVKELLAGGVVFTPKDLALSGQEIMDYLEIEPGEQVGNLIKELIKRTHSNPTINTKEGLKRQLDNITLITHPNPSQERVTR